MRADPIPVPRVVSRMRPFWPRAAPNRTSATPATSASLAKWMSRPSPSSKNFSASKPIHFFDTFAADSVLPPLTMAGKATPRCTSWSSATSSLSRTSLTACSTSSGSAPFGVGTLMRSLFRTPFSRSTIAPLIPVPPMSTPTARFVFDAMGPAYPARPGRSVGSIQIEGGHHGGRQREVLVQPHDRGGREGLRVARDRSRRPLRHPRGGRERPRDPPRAFAGMVRRRSARRRLGLIRRNWRERRIVRPRRPGEDLMDKQRDFVLRTIEERGVKFVRLWFTDVIGTLKSVAIAPAEVEGLTRSYESDLLAHPDPTTFQILPWRGEIDPTARMFCDITTPDGQPAVADPRHVLKRALAKAADAGFTFYTHPEIEFYLLKSSSFGADGPEPVDSAGYFDNVPGGTAHDFRRRSVRMLEDLGISVEYSHHEGGPGQNEIDLRYADALATADNIMTFRTVIKEVAIEQGVYATFMPKPISGQPGSGMHTHMSLFEGDVNAFYEEGAQYQLSKVGRQFIAGLLRHANEISAVTNQFVNSYKRLWGGDEAPSFVTWGHNNRSALVRVPMYKPNKGQSSRVEYRALDSAANPYLSYALMLAAGLKGIEEEYELPPEAEDNVWSLSDAERRALGYSALPASLDHALEYMEDSELVAETLGEQVFNYVLLNKRKEWEAYRGQVTPLELKNNLELL